MKRLISIIILTQLTFLHADNYSLSFDGSDDYVDLSYTNGQIESEISISAWVNLNSNSNGGHIIFNGFGGTDANWYWGMILEDSDAGGGIQPKIMLHTDQGINGAGHKPSPNNGIIAPNSGWHHVAMTYGNNTLKIYLDGTEVHTETVQGNDVTESSRVNIGGWEYSDETFTGSMDGKIDEISVWNRALTGAEVQNYMATALIGDESDLVGYWNFNESVGSALTDQTSNGNDGTIVGATWDEDGAPVDPPPPPPNADNYSLSFDGTDDYARIENFPDISSGDATLQFWVKVHSFNNGYIFGQWNGNQMHFLNDGNLFVTDDWTNIEFDYSLNEWGNISIVKDENGSKLYVNGMLESETNSIAWTGIQQTELTIGNQWDLSCCWFDGNIDEIRVWNTALSQEQIQDNMNTQLSGDEDGLEGYWDFNDGEGTTLTDLSGNENHGTINGATWDEDGAPVEPNSIAELTVQEVDGGLGTTVSIPIDIDLMGIDISSTEIRFSGFQDHVDFLEVDTTGTLVGAAGWSIEVNEQEDLLITGSYGSTEISANGTLFKLKFEIPEEVGVEFVPINITHAEMDELEGTIGITNGGINIQELLWGDVSQNDDVSLYDASLVLKYLVGTETLDETQLIVADVTQDATISALDATAIAQYVVEIIDELPVDNTQNLSGGGEFVINEDEFSPGALLEIPVLLTGGNNLLSFEFDISYDSDIVTFENVEWSEMINHFTIEENTEDGSIRFAGMGTTPDGEEGVFTTVSLFVASDFNGESLDVTVNRSRINESEPIEDLVITFINTALGVDANAIPKVYALRQNYPNPFNPTTQIKYDLPEDALVTISIYDLMGRSIKSLVNSNQSAGYRSIQWNATNSLGEPVSAGMYIYTIQAGDFRQVKKMILLK